MEYRIIFKSRHEELFKKAKEEIVKILDSYGIPPDIDQKRYSSSVELQIKSPVDGHRNLDDLMDEDGHVDLNKVYD